MFCVATRGKSRSLREYWQNRLEVRRKKKLLHARGVRKREARCLRPEDGSSCATQAGLPVLVLGQRKCPRMPLPLKHLLLQ